MFYIHQNTCISPQQTFNEVALDIPAVIVDNKLIAKEPAYEGIPLSMLRRMGKAVRIGVGAALPLARNEVKPNGIIIGTANGGMEDCIKFLNQIIDYEEGTLTPTNFVQSTSNAIAGQIGMLSANQNYNITHVHRGLAFENAVLDVAMLLKENPKATYLLGGLDEISAYNYNIDFLADCFKDEKVSQDSLYNSNTKGTIAGEGAAMFLVNNNSQNAFAHVKTITTLHTRDAGMLVERLKNFLATNLDGKSVDLFLSGENGDNRQTKYITAIEAVLNSDTTIARFKHLTGDHPTASAISLWLATHLLQQQVIPAHMLKKGTSDKPFSTILIYNNFKDQQHSFMLVESV